MQNSTQDKVTNPEYFIRTRKSYNNLNAVNEDLKTFYDWSKYEVGYYIPQPKYKNWVPNWLIRLITKS